MVLGKDEDVKSQNSRELENQREGHINQPDWSTGLGRQLKLAGKYCEANDFQPPK